MSEKSQEIAYRYFWIIDGKRPLYYKLAIITNEVKSGQCKMVCGTTKWTFLILSNKEENFILKVVLYKDTGTCHGVHVVTLAFNLYILTVRDS